MPLIAALIGWFTNYLAVKMLFHPKEKKKILFVEVQGIFPKRQKVLAEKLGKVVAQELISFDDIKNKLKKSNNLNGVTDLVEGKIDWFLSEGLEEISPFLATFMSDKKRDKVKTYILDEVDAMLPIAIENYINQAEKELDVEKMVYDKVVAFSSEKLEGILQDILAKEFRFIELVGAVLGFLIGLIQVLLGLAIGVWG